jgi:hypothetical protein
MKKNNKNKKCDVFKTVTGPWRDLQFQKSHHSNYLVRFFSQQGFPKFIIFTVVLFDDDIYLTIPVELQFHVIGRSFMV